MSFKVVNVFNLPGVDWGDQLLAPLKAGLVNGVWHTEEEIIKNGAGADALICSGSAQPFNRRVIAGLTKCRIIASSGIGYNSTDLEAATEYGIVVTNVPDLVLDEVSGRAMAFMLALNHRLFVLDKAVRKKPVFFVFDRAALHEFAFPIHRMCEQTLGIVGLGKIGTATALKAKGMGMRVIAYDPYVFRGVMRTHGVIPVDMDTLLAESDYVSLHTPLTDETANIMGGREFERMKRTAYFINTARGGCVDEGALIKALQDGLIAGAGLDVTSTDPIAVDNPLLNLSNVILTGHSAGISVTAEAEVWSKPMTQVVKALAGEWPEYAVNPEVRKTWLKKWGNG